LPASCSDRFAVCIVGRLGAPAEFVAVGLNAALDFRGSLFEYR
jgi:hypothetical protein